MKQLNKLLCGIMLLLINSFPAYAAEKPGMADTMRSNGKIYVVVSVCLMILTGLILYVINIDIRVRKIEKDQ